MLLPDALDADSLALAEATAICASHRDVWLLETAAGHLRPNSKNERTELRLYRILDGIHTLRAAAPFLGTVEQKLETIRGLLANVSSGVVVASHKIIAARALISLLSSLDLQFVVEVKHEHPVMFTRCKDGEGSPRIPERIVTAEWRRVRLPVDAAQAMGALLGQGLSDGIAVQFFAISVGGIQGYRRGVVVAATNFERPHYRLPELVRLLYLERWIRLQVRAEKRRENSPTSAVRSIATDGFNVAVRANRRLSHIQDAKDAIVRTATATLAPQLRQSLGANRARLNVVELFAGAGGMGLGFLLAQPHAARTFGISASAEIHPVYTETLRRNHAYLAESGVVTGDRVPSTVEPLDLCRPDVHRRVKAIAAERGDVDIVIGGPPCQGFSSANRNSWSGANPNNQLVDAFLDCIATLQPRVLLMENVQGILWTPRGEDSGLSVASHVVKRLNSMGYGVHPKMLDAVWFGVPQNRNRFFLMGIHRDLGYGADSFGPWGPFPVPTHGPGTDHPFVTVHDAISDLPRVGNGASVSELPYENIPNDETNAFLRAMRAGAPPDLIWDHVTSRHADYVIERYRGIPQGKNWSAVRHLMTNYANVERTHSNIYRRLVYNEPAITIGHYRKSMIVHPRQSRGLSLREAARLQSFPDWFRFAGGNGRGNSGLMHQQQQLANAVCPLVTKAVAEFVLQL